MKNPLRLVDKRTLTVILGGTVIVTLISVISIVLTFSRRNRRALMAERNRIERDRQALTGSAGFGIEDFYRDIRDPRQGVTYPARPRRSVWTEDEVIFYWIDPVEAGIQSLSAKNDARVLQSLRDGTTP